MSGLLAQAERETRRPAPDDWRPEAKRDDIEAAHQRDALTREQRERVSERDLLRHCRRAVAQACPKLSREQRDDIASELVMRTHRRTGTWTPTRRQLAGYWLRATAAQVARDYTARVRHEAAAAADVAEPETDESPSPLVRAHASADPVAPMDADAEHVAGALGLDADGSATVAAALSGWGSALDVAAGLGISHAAARKRISRGRQSIARRYPDPAALLDALADALATDPEADPTRVRLSAAERAARRAVEALADTTPAPHAAGGWRAQSDYLQARDCHAPRDWATGATYGNRARALTAYLQAHADRQAPTYPQPERRSDRRPMVRVADGYAVRGTDAEEAAHADAAWARVMSRCASGDR